MTAPKKKAGPKKHRGGTQTRVAKRASNVTIGTRCTLEERDRWQAAADEAGVTLSEVARQAWDALAERMEALARIHRKR